MIIKIHSNIINIKIYLDFSCKHVNISSLVLRIRNFLFSTTCNSTKLDWPVMSQPKLFFLPAQYLLPEKTRYNEKFYIQNHPINFPWRTEFDESTETLWLDYMQLRIQFTGTRQSWCSAQQYNAFRLLCYLHHAPCRLGFKRFQHVRFVLMLKLYKVWKENLKNVGSIKITRMMTPNFLLINSEVHRVVIL